jgi:nucleoside-diphosphate-sugar epimerase
MNTIFIAGTAGFMGSNLASRLLAVHLKPKPHDCAIYTPDSPKQRRTFQVPDPTYRWARR